MSNSREIEKYAEDFESVNWVPRVLVIGTVIGALTGLLGAYLLVLRSKNDPEPPTLDAREGVKLGVLLFGLLRAVSLLGREE